MRSTRENETVRRKQKKIYNFRVYKILRKTLGTTLTNYLFFCGRIVRLYLQLVTKSLVRHFKNFLLLSLVSENV